MYLDLLCLACLETEFVTGVNTIPQNVDLMMAIVTNSMQNTQVAMLNTLNA